MTKSPETSVWLYHCVILVVKSAVSSLPHNAFASAWKARTCYSGQLSSLVNMTDKSTCCFDLLSQRNSISKLWKRSFDIVTITALYKSTYLLTYLLILWHSQSSFSHHATLSNKILVILSVHSLKTAAAIEVRDSVTRIQRQSKVAHLHANVVRHLVCRRNYPLRDAAGRQQLLRLHLSLPIFPFALVWWARLFLLCDHCACAVVHDFRSTSRRFRSPSRSIGLQFNLSQFRLIISHKKKN